MAFSKGSPDLCLNVAEWQQFLWVPSINAIPYGPGQFSAYRINVLFLPSTHARTRARTHTWDLFNRSITQGELLYLQSGWWSNVCRWRVALPSLKSVDMANTRTRYKEQLSTTLPDLHANTQGESYSDHVCDDVCEAIQHHCVQTGLFHAYLVWYFKILSSPYLQSRVI